MLVSSEAAMGSSRRGVVAMCPEVAAVLCRVAGDDLALHPRYSELVDLQDFGNHPPLDAGPGLLDHVRLLDCVILTDLCSLGSARTGGLLPYRNPEEPDAGHALVTRFCHLDDGRIVKKPPDQGGFAVHPRRGSLPGSAGTGGCGRTRRPRSLPPEPSSTPLRSCC